MKNRQLHTVSRHKSLEQACYGSYNKPQFKRKDTRFHIDVFLLTTAVFFGTQNVFEDERWLI